MMSENMDAIHIWHDNIQSEQRNILLHGETRLFIITEEVTRTQTYLPSDRECTIVIFLPGGNILLLVWNSTDNDVAACTNSQLPRLFYEEYKLFSTRYHLSEITVCNKKKHYYSVTTVLIFMLYGLNESLQLVNLFNNN